VISSSLRFSTISTLFASLTVALCALPAAAQEKLQKVDIDWNKVVLVSKSTPTLQVVTNPMLNPGSPIHDGSFSALKALGADYVRYVPWLPYPKIAVAELDPPTKDKTSWDFKYIDPVTKDLLAATEGHSTVMNFSTIPAWMFKTDQPVKYPEDPNQVFWKYTQGTELRDPTGKELGDYFGRLVSWYTKGGFADENGKRYESGYHYKFPIWEVLNEIDFEHKTTPEDYTKRYDAIVEGIRKVSPETKFMGLALAAPEWHLSLQRSVAVGHSPRNRFICDRRRRSGQPDRPRSTLRRSPGVGPDLSRSGSAREWDARSHRCEHRGTLVGAARGQLRMAGHPGDCALVLCSRGGKRCLTFWRQAVGLGPAGMGGFAMPQ